MRDYPREKESINQNHNPKERGKKQAVLENRFEDVSFLSTLLGSGRGDKNRLRVHHFPHDPPRLH